MRRITSLLLLMLFIGTTAFAQNARNELSEHEKSIKMEQMRDLQKSADIADHRTIVQSEDAGDIVFNLDVESIVLDNQVLGVEFDGTYLWITGAGNAADPNYLYKVDPVAGTLVASYQQPAAATVWGIRDLVYNEDDGLIYGGNETTFFSFDPVAETWATLFTSTFGTIRGLAYDGTHFWCKSFGDPLYEFDVAGNLINTYPLTVASATYGAAYDDNEGFLYLFSQDDAVFYQFGLDGVHTGVTIDVSAAQAAGIAGGAFFDFGVLVPGVATLGFVLQGTPDIVAAVELYPSVVYTNDVGISAISQPISGYDLTNAEPVTFMLKNFGSNAQSNIDWEVSWSGSPLTGTYTETLEPGEAVQIDAGTVDLSAFGEYEFDICTMLTGDEFPGNDCKAKTVVNAPAPTLAYPQSVDYWTGSTDGSTKTETSLVKGVTTEDGWFLFDVSNIPPGSTVTSVTFHGYVYETNFPYFSLTPLALDPLTAAPADLYAAITAGAGIDLAYAYNNEGSSFAPGWKEYALGGTVNQDLTDALVQGWFAVGMASRDNSATYFVNFEGWNEANVPYLELEFAPPLDNDLAITAITSPETGIELSDSEMVTVTISNLGLEAQSNFDVSYSFASDNPVTETVAETLEAGASMEYTFTATADLSELGVYTFTCCTELVGDGDPDNDCMDKTIANNEMGKISGTMKDAWTNLGLGGVLVEAGGESTTSAGGPFGTFYYLDIAPGTYDVVASKAGYITKTISGVVVTSGTTTNLNIALVPYVAPVLLSATPGVGTVTLEWEPIVEEGSKSFSNQTTAAFISYPEKPADTKVASTPDPEVIRQGGDDIASATVIAALPFNETGTTVGYTNDYDEACPYTGGTAPDVVYSFTPVDDVFIDIDLCGSSYDTKVYVYENAHTPGSPYACNDDFYGSGDPCGSFVSAIFGLGLTGGNTYYIVVDGYGTNSGEYMLDVSEFVPCVVECPEGGIPEIELCGEDLNGGCNSEIPAYEPIACGDIICGTAWADTASRDTDWYELTLDEPGVITWSGMAEFPLLLFVLDSPEDCESFTIQESATAAACEEAVIELPLPAGTYWLFAAPSVFEGFPCGSEFNDYYVSLECGPIPTTFNVYRDGSLYATDIVTPYFTDDNFSSFDEHCYQVSQILQNAAESSLSNELCATPDAPAGATCDNPFMVDALPFEGLGFTTEGFGDELNSSMACGSSYMNGDDFVFEFTPAADMNVRISLTNTASWVGVFLTEGCPDVGTCVEFATASAGNPVIESVDVMAGIQYFITVSTFPSPQFTPFDIMIEENVFSSISGVVTDPMAKAFVEGATITLSDGENTYTATTDESGAYLLEDVLVGTYDVSAAKTGYISQTVEGLLIEDGVAAVQDFALEFMIPELLTATPSFTGVDLTWQGNPLFDVFADRSSAKVSVTNMAETTAVHGPTKVINTIAGKAIGDTCSNPILVDAIPYTDANTTCGRGNTADATCLGYYDGGEDIFYMFTLTEEMTLDITFETTTTWTGMLLTQNCPADSTCVATVTNTGAGGGSITETLAAGDYYIMIDTWPTPDCIPDFTLTISEYIPCVLECPAGAIAEDEACPEDGYVDDFNGGCNSEVPVFSQVNCGDVVCGTASTYVSEGSNLRDTDWYELTITEPQLISFAVTAEFPVIAGLIEQVVPGVPGCDNITGYIAPFISGAECEEVSFEVTLLPGTHYFFVAPGVFEGFPCGTSNDYIASWTCTETFISYYDVYRDDMVDPIATVYGNTYFDETAMQGETYCYEVTQHATPDILLGPSNELCADVPIQPEIMVDPMALTETLLPEASSIQTLSVANTAIGMLDFSVNVELGGAPVSKLVAPASYDELSILKGTNLNPTDEGIECPEGTLISQAAVNFGTAMNGDEDGGYELYQSFDGGSQFTGLRFWTISAFHDGVAWGPCDGIDPRPFTIGFYNDNAGEPGTLVDEFLIEVTRVNTGILFAGSYDVWEYTATFPSAVSMVSGWFSVQSMVGTGADCWSLFLNEVGGTIGQCLQSDGTAFTLQEEPMGFCLIGESVSPWLVVSPLSGTIDGVGQMDLNVYFDAAGLEAGEYTANIAISSNDPLAPVVDVPVTLTVTGDFGIISGVVTDPISKGPVQGVTITADELRASYTATTDETGYYELQAPVGLYNVMAEKVGYIPQTIEGVEVLKDETTTQDFMLEFATPVLTYANGGVGEISLGWTGNPLVDGDIARASISASNTEETQANTMSKEEQLHGPVSIVPKATSGRAVGDDCDNPKILDMTTFPVVDNDSTCGRGNNYSETCLGNYDGGEDIVYQFTIDETKDLEFVLTTATTWTGMLITQECPIAQDCLASISSSASNETLLATLDAGTYYLMIDTWAAPDCIPEFILEINEFIPEPGDICATAVTAVEGLNSAPAQPYWYEFTPTENKVLNISACIDGQSIDTKLEVYDDCGGNLVAANDDLYDDCGAYSYASGVSFMATAGVSYKIFWLDSWSSEAFDFTIEMEELCTVECPPGAIAEGEACPEDGYVDDFNGGCNSDVPVFSVVNCGDVVCGTASTYVFEDQNRRDTDWYEFTITEPKLVTFNVTAEFPVIGGLIQQIEPGVAGCDNITGSIAPFFSGDPCEEMSITVELIPGTHYFFVSLGVFEGYPCGAANDYVASWECADTFITYYDVMRDGEVIAQSYANTYVDTDIEADVEYCYTVDQVIEPGLTTAPSNELCASMLCAEGCDYVMNFTDSYGDGWNGANVTLMLDGNVFGVYTLSGGAVGQEIVTLCDGLDLDLVWAPGSYPSECGFEMLDPAGNVLVSFLAGGAPVAGEFFSGVTDCDAMLQQDISLEAGWNAWSSYIAPASKATMEDVLTPIVDDMIVTQYFTELYYPEFGINTFGDFHAEHGYFTKMENAAVLTIAGVMVEPMVSLTEGWNLMAVAQECSVAAADVFGNLPGLVIAWDPVGNGIYYPAGNLFTLVDLMPGMAYWVKVDADVDYTFPGCDATDASGHSSSLRAKNNTNWNDVNYTSINHAVVFNASSIGSLQEGDMIGAFTSNGWCAGLVEFTGENFGLNLFGDDMTTENVDGFIENENLSFRLFRPATEEEFDIEVTYSFDAPNANGLFAINGVSVVTDLKLAATNIGATLLNGLNIYPNPSSGIFNIAISNIDEDINYVVLNAQGQEVYTGSLADSQVLDLSAEPKGIYFIKFMNDSVLGIEKLVIK